MTPLQGTLTGTRGWGRRNKIGKKVSEWTNLNLAASNKGIGEQGVVERDSHDAPTPV